MRIQMLFFVFIILMTNSYCYSQSLKIDGFIGAGYLQSTECDSTNLQLNKDVWRHNKASVAIEVYKHCYLGVSLLNMQMAYSDLFGINPKKISNVPTLMLNYKANAKHKLSIDGGIEICRTNYNRDINSIPYQLLANMVLIWGIM
jgi:hypothetical protein